MLKGTLTVNLDPPYVHFFTSDDSYSCCTECTEEEIHRLILELGSLVEEKHTLKECLIRTRGQFPRKLLSRYNLLPREMPLKKKVS